MGNMKFDLFYLGVFWQTPRAIPPNDWSQWLPALFCDDLILQNCSLFVDTEKREKILNTKKRFPHAWIIGTIAKTQRQKPKLKQQISYNPFQNESFMCGVRPCFSSKVINEFFNGCFS